LKGDIVILEAHHIRAAQLIVPKIIPEINKINRRFILSIAGESGSGKSETAAAIANELDQLKIKSVVVI